MSFRLFLRVSFSMKIGINASFLRKPFTGIGQVTVHFLHVLIEREKNHPSGDEYVLFVEQMPDAAFRDLLPSHFSVVCKLPLYKRDDLFRKIWWEKWMIPRISLQEGCDRFLSLYQCPTTFPKGFPHLMLVHDLIPRIFPAYLSNSRKITYWKNTEKGIMSASHVLSVSENTALDLHQKLGLSREDISVSVISVNPLFDEAISQEKVQAIKEKYALKSPYFYVGGGLELRKNVEGVLLAYKSVVDAFHARKLQTPVPRLVISGKLMPELAPMVTDVQKLVKDLEIADYVDILGFVPSEDLPALYASADFFVFASRYEGFGMPVLESMKSGTTVLTARNSSLPEVGADTVVYCDADDVEDIAHKMQMLITDPAMRSDLADQALERAKRFSWHSFCDTVLLKIHT